MNGQHRCTEVLDPNACTLGDCREQCYQKHKGNGICELSSDMSHYGCICIFDC